MKDFEKSIKIDYRDVDRFSDIRFDSLLQVLGSVSMYHTVKIGFEPDYMDELGLMWVLRQWKVRLEETRYYARDLKFLTFAVFDKGVCSYRYYSISDDTGKVIGTAVAQWLVIDLEKRRMARIPESIADLYIGKDRSLTKIQQAIVDSIDTEALRRRKDVTWTSEKVIEVRFGEIDPNGHVNNVKYVEWAMETLKTPLDESFLIENHPLELTIVYKKEKMPLGHIVSKACLTGQDSYHEILDEDGTLLSIIEMTWRQRELQ